MHVYVSHFSAASAVFTQRLESLCEVLNKDTCFALEMTAQQSLGWAFSLSFMAEMDLKKRKG